MAIGVCTRLVIHKIWIHVGIPIDRRGHWLWIIVGLMPIHWHHILVANRTFGRGIRILIILCFPSHSPSPYNAQYDNNNKGYSAHNSTSYPCIVCFVVILTESKIRAIREIVRWASSLFITALLCAKLIRAVRIFRPHFPGFNLLVVNKNFYFLIRVFIRVYN